MTLRGLTEAASAGTYPSALSKPLLVMPTNQQAERVEPESPGQRKVFG